MDELSKALARVEDHARMTWGFIEERKSAEGRRMLRNLTLDLANALEQAIPQDKLVQAESISELVYGIIENLPPDWG